MIGHAMPPSRGTLLACFADDGRLFGHVMLLEGSCDFLEDLSFLKGRRGLSDYIRFRGSYIEYDALLTHSMVVDRLYIPWQGQGM